MDIRGVKLICVIKRRNEYDLLCQPNEVCLDQQVVVVWTASSQENSSSSHLLGR